MRSRFIRSLAAVAGLVLFPLSTNADTSFSREDAFEVGPWSQSRIDSEIARLRCVFGDQFDEVDEWPEVPGHVFEFRDVHVAEAGEIVYRANAVDPVAQYAIRSVGGGRSPLNLGQGWNPDIIRLGGWPAGHCSEE